MAYLDLVYLASFMPANAIINTNDQQEKLASLQLKVSPERNSVDYSSVSHSIRLSSLSKSPLQSPQKHTQSKRTSSVDADNYSIEALKLKGKLEIPPGCEPDSQTAEDLAKEFQSLTRVDVVRFLIARKGSYDLAKAMIIKERAWRNQTFPIKQEDLEPVMKTGCFFDYGYAKNGSPCVYMRGGLYDKKVATPRQYALAAAHFIDHAIEKSRIRPLEEGGDGTAQVNVTVIVHSSAVEGVENSTGADMDFIKLFTQVLSDNYPERLRNLIIFPFPWYGRAIWGVAKVFIDKRTQEKIQLLPAKWGVETPPELLSLIDIDELPQCMGGRCKRPLPTYEDLLSTVVK